MPNIGAPVQGYYYDQNTDTLRPIAGLGAQGPKGDTGPQGPPSAPAGQAENISLTGTNVTVPAVGWQKVPLNTQNVGFNWDNTNKRWVCPTTGAYNISGLVSFTMLSAQNTRLIVSIWVNGVERSRGTDYTAGTTTSLGAGGIAYCDTYLFAGDYVELYSYTNPVKAVDWVGGTSNSNMLTIRMVTGTGATGAAGAPGAPGPAGPSTPYPIFSLKGAGDNAIPSVSQITVNSTSVTSITQINISYYPYPGSPPMAPIARNLRPGSVIYMMDQASPGNNATYLITALISDNGAPNYYTAYSVSYVTATGGFIIDRQVMFGLGGTELEELALGVVGTIRGTGTLALSSTPQVAMTLAPIQLKTQRQYAYNVYVRAVTATAQNNGNITSDIPSGVVLSVNYNIVILPGGTSFYFPIMYRQFFYCSAAGNYTLNCKLSIASGSGTAYLDQGGYLSIEDLGPLR
jgi:hypothetical protein